MPPINDDYRLAVNLLDLDGVFPSLVTKTLGGKISTKNVITPENGEAPAAILQCDLLTAAMALDVLRMEARKLDDKRVRVYVRDADGSWSRVSHDVPLTLLRPPLATIGVVQQIVTNPEVFDGVRPEDLIAPSTQGVQVNAPSLLG